MSVTYETLVEHYKGEMVGGDAIVMIDNKRVVLGRKFGPNFEWSDVGLDLIKTYEAVLEAQKSAEANKKK